MNLTSKGFDYDRSKVNYSFHRRPDPEIESFIYKALESSRTILNIGAGSGSYEPENKFVIAVEPSAKMRQQRAVNNKTPAVIAKADNLPFDTGAFDVAMAILTVHHWEDLPIGLQELRRVSKNKIVIMTFDPDLVGNFWNKDYFPELIAIEKSRYPTIQKIKQILGGNCEEQIIPVPLQCTDGFQEAFYGRPEAFLNPEIRLAQSSWGFLNPGKEEELVKRIADDLQSGLWDKKYSKIRTQPYLSCGLKLLIFTNFK